MAQTAANTIRLNCGIAARHVEMIADAALSPGYLCRRTTTGANTCAKHATAGGIAECLIACEDVLRSKTIDDAYAADDPVQLVIPQKGDIVLLKLAAAATAVTRAHTLESAGDGTVRIYAAGVRLFQVVEAVDNSAGATEVFVKAAVL